jgi:hypothetical protein
LSTTYSQYLRVAGRSSRASPGSEFAAAKAAKHFQPVPGYRTFEKKAWHFVLPVHCFLQLAESSWGHSRPGTILLETDLQSNFRSSFLILHYISQKMSGGAKAAKSFLLRYGYRIKKNRLLFECSLESGSRY